MGEEDQACHSEALRSQIRDMERRLAAEFPRDLAPRSVVISADGVEYKAFFSARPFGDGTVFFKFQCLIVNNPPGMTE
jgi:hypothetical protein